MNSGNIDSQVFGVGKEMSEQLEMGEDSEEKHCTLEQLCQDHKQSKPIEQLRKSQEEHQPPGNQHQPEHHQLLDLQDKTSEQKHLPQKQHQPLEQQLLHEQIREQQKSLDSQQHIPLSQQHQLQEQQKKQVDKHQSPEQQQQQTEQQHQSVKQRDHPGQQGQTVEQQQLHLQPKINEHIKQSNILEQQHRTKQQLKNKPSLQEQKQNIQQQIKKQKKNLVGENQERINYLVQASRAMVTMKTKGAKSTVISDSQVIAAQAGSLAAAIGRRCVMRLAPALKRTLCKGCGIVLVFGVNARVRHLSRRQKHLVVTCLTCHTIKRFVNDPKHKLWCEQKEATI